MNGPQITNPLVESQPEADSKPPDLADQRCVARWNRHAASRTSQWARSLFLNKAVAPAFIQFAEMHCRPQQRWRLIGMRECGNGATLAELGRSL